MDIEESIKVLDEIAEGFENLSAEVCARKDLIALWAGRAKGIRQAIAVINAHRKANPNDPLTLEQLREMDGEPVWDPNLGEWGIVDIHGFNGKGCIRYVNNWWHPRCLMSRRFYRRKPGDTLISSGEEPGPQKDTEPWKDFLMTRFERSERPK